MDKVQREELLAAARALGPMTFNRLVASVSEVQEIGRLRFWQEELIEQLSGGAGPRIVCPADFIAVFGGVEPLPVPPSVITREDFLSDPNYHYYLGDAAIPDEWVALAWEAVPEFRENVSYGFAREASKIGTLGSSRSHLEYLDHILPLPRLVELYMRVREGSPHREPEFRPTFERVFKERMAAFPPPLTKQEIIAALGEELAEQLGAHDDEAYPA